MNAKRSHSAPVSSKDTFDKLSLDEKIREFSSGYRVPQTRSKEKAFELLQTKMDKLPGTKPATRTLLYWVSAAAVLVLAVLFSIYNNSSQKTIIAQNGEHLNYILPDGSDVVLNAGSKMTFSQSDFVDERKLKLEGEAFFSVEKGTSFKIETESGTIEVLGTSLNVYARENHFEVACLTGKVRVRSVDAVETILPGESVVLNGNVLLKQSNLDINKMASWRSGIFHFEGTPLISIFGEIERQFDVKIQARGVSNRYFSGSFSNKSIDEVLDVVCIPMGLTYEIQEGNRIKIKTGTE